MSLGVRLAGLLVLLTSSLPSAAGALWIRGGDQLHEIDAMANRLVRTIVVDDGQALAADEGGGWIVAKDRLHRFEAPGSTAWFIDLVPPFKQPSFLAIDPRGRLLWVVGKDSLLRLSLPERTTAVFAFEGNKARAVDAGLDGSL